NILKFIIIISLSSVNAVTRITLNPVALDNLSVRAIAEDKNGFIWFGTDTGLYSYDGYEVTKHNIQNQNDADFSETLIKSIYSDADSNLWLGTFYGLVKYNLEFRTVQYFKHDLKVNNSISSDFIYSISKFNDKNLLLSSARGITIFDKEQHTAKNFFNKTTNKSLPQNKLVFTATKESDDKIWASTQNGIAKINMKTKGVNEFALPIEKHSKVYQVYRRRNKDVLVATKEGLFLYDRKREEFNAITPFFSNKNTYRVIEDDNESLWISVIGEGVFILKKGGQIKSIEPSSSSYKDLFLNTQRFFIDSSKNIWFSSPKHGVVWLNPDTLHFSSIDSKDLPCLISTSLTGIEKLTEHSINLSSTRGVAELNFKTNQCKLVGVQNAGKTIYPYAMKTYTDQQDRLWLGTNKGLYIRKNKGESFVFDNRLGKTNIFDILETKNNDLYFATSEGIYIRKKSGESLRINPSSLDSDLVAFKFLTTPNGELLVGGWQGLFKINKDFTLTKEDLLPQKIQNRPIRTMFVDSKENLWIGVENTGLYVFSPERLLIFKVNDMERLNSKGRFMSFFEVSPNEIWTSSNSGLSRINLYTKKIDNFSKKDGILNERFNPNSATWIGDRIVFVNMSGLTIFNPKQIKKSSSSPTPFITKLFINNQEVTLNRVHNNFKLDRDILYVKDIVLNNEQSTFSIDFTDIQFKTPSKSRFAYKLEGFEEKWNHTTSKYRRATYTDVPGGDYVFKFKVASENGSWSLPRELSIEVLPPLWLTKTAFFIYTLAGIFLIYLLIKWRTKALEVRSLKLEKKIQARTQELSEEKNKVEKLLDKKTDEIANISHEFRTPLSLILGPTKELLDSEPESRVTNKLEIIQRNSNRLLRMVDQLLNLESDKVNAISNKVLISPSDIIDSCHQAFIPLARSKNISLALLRNDEFATNFTMDGVEKVLTNLLSNAIKYTKQDGEVTIESRLEDNKWVLSVSDTGVGIENKNHHAVFERFNRVIDSDSEVITGAGIGLALVKQIVENNGGQISLTSELGKGTQVTIAFSSLSIVNVQKSTTANESLIHTELSILQAPELTSFSSPSEELSTNGLKKILVVEDNHEMLAFISRCLSPTYNVLTANNGKEGLEKAIAEVPDLIVSDIMMPIMDGIEFLTQTRSSPITDHIPFVLLTAKGDKQSKLEGLNLSADDYVTKPFDKDELNARISNLIKMRESLYQKFSQSISSATTSLDSTVSRENSPSEEAITTREHEFIQNLNACLNRCYQDPEVRIAKIASDLALSERQFFRKLKSISDMTPNMYLRQFRLEKACALLAQGMPASSVSLEVGFSSQSYFSKCFRDKYGTSPAKFASANK
ncbi:MAG: response regulator, partial [Kangiellaceae bacterium]|nr:response regulator [Kangiellaceae bacterium]